MNKLISVIIPAYNEEKRIGKCLESIINQTYKNIEILVIDDGSKDNTVKVINGYKDKRIRVISIENSGQGAARNIGIKKAKGELITFVDSDDYIANNMIELLYNDMIKNKSEISICNIIKVVGEDEIRFNNYENITKDKRTNFIISHPGPVARLYKKELFLKNNLYFLEKMIYEDLGTIPLLGVYTNKISTINECLYYYVIHKNSSMNQVKYSKKLEDIFKVMEHLKNKFGNKYKELLEYLYIEHLLYSANLRFLNFKEGKKHSIYISKYIKTNFPNWKKNKIYKLKSKKFKFFCNLAYYRLFMLCKIIKKIGGK